MMLTFKSLYEFIDQYAKLHGRPPVRFVLHDGLLKRGTFFQPHAFVDDGRKDSNSRRATKPSNHRAIPVAFS